jgi:hypothetical protein
MLDLEDRAVGYAGLHAHQPWPSLAKEAETLLR